MLVIFRFDNFFFIFCFLLFSLDVVHWVLFNFRFKYDFYNMFRSKYDFYV